MTDGVAAIQPTWLKFLRCVPNPARYVPSRGWFVMGHTHIDNIRVGANRGLNIAITTSL